MNEPDENLLYGTLLFIGAFAVFSVGAGIICAVLWMLE